MQANDKTKRLDGYGNSAPSRSYRDLCNFYDFLHIDNEIKLCSCKEDITRVTASWKVPKQAFADLLSSCKAALKRMNTALDGKKTKEKARGGDVRAARVAVGAFQRDSTGPDKSKTNPIQEGTDGSLTSMPCADLKYNETEGKWQLTHSSLTPGVMDDVPVCIQVECASLTSKCPELIVQADQQAKKFAKGVDRTTYKRCHRKLNDLAMKDLRVC